MPLTDEQINEQLTSALDESDAESRLHHLHVLSYDTAGPFGLPLPAGAEGSEHLSVYMIDVAGSDERVDAFIAKAVVHAVAEHEKSRRRPDFAVVTFATWMVSLTPGDIAALAHAQHLAARNRLQEHPDAQDATCVYGVHRDGRRWSGKRVHTGRNTGTEAPVLHTGAPRPDEWLRQAFGPAMLQLVGLWL